MQGNNTRAIAHYDAVEDLFKEADQISKKRKVGETISAAFMNDSVRSYEPPPAERILTNFYKAMAFWGDGDAQGARIEFNRANERARLAVESYEKELNKAREEAAKEGKDVEEGIERDEVKGAVSANFPNVDQWEVFDDFVNPAVAYVNALFLASSYGADVNKAETLLKRVRGMVGDNPVLNEDLLNLRTKGRLATSPTQSWVVFEGGLSPVLRDKKFKTPWVIPTGIINISVALPEMVDRTTGLANPRLFMGEEQLAITPLADMKKVMQTEFKHRWKGVVSRAFASAVTKGAVQATANEHLGLIGNLAGWVYSATTTKSDIRGWKSMPERWSVAKVDVSKDNVIRIPYGSGLIKEVAVNPQNSLIYIKQPSPMAEPLVQVLAL